MSNKKVVVVTGCSAGVGRATALEFGKKGHAVGLISRNQKRLAHLKKEIELAGGKAFIAACDVAEYDQVDKAAQLIEKSLGPLDIWVNNAMAAIFAPFLEMRPEEYLRVTEVTYLGCVYGTMAALKRMRQRDHGLIIQVGSALAYRGIPLQSAYCGAKHAIKGFTESVRVELIHEKSNIHVTMVHLPGLNTPQFSWVRSRLKRKAQPVPPIYQPEVAARAIYTAATQKNRREWIVGINAQAAITGNKWLPWLVDFYLSKTGYASQQYNGREDPNRPDNLFQTVDGDFGAHGVFDQRSKTGSLQFWMSTHRKIIMLSAVVLICALTSLFIGLFHFRHLT
jgi:short-subunit dehydrogenase